MRRRKIFVAAVISALLLSGCGSSAKAPEATVPPVAESTEKQPPASKGSTIFEDKNVYQNVTELFEKGTVANVYNRDDYRNDLVKTIDGNYSQFKIRDEEDALRSFEQIKKLVGITAPAEELVLSRVMDGPDEGEVIYDFSQVYKGIPVLSASIRVIVGSNGYPNWFTGSFVPDIALDTLEPAISEEEMYALVKKMDDVKNVYDDMQLCIIADGTTDYKPMLAYMVTVDAMTGVWNNPDKKILLDFLYIVNADTGELIRANQLTIVD